MYAQIQTHLQKTLDDIRAAGLYKTERVITSPQQVHIDVNGKKVINLCANNYLGLAQHPAIRQAAHEALDTYGYGMASVRFICGTQSIHKQLESRLTSFLGFNEAAGGGGGGGGGGDTILYTSCWDANGGLFETLLGPEDAVLSDELNHASIIDGIRLCKAQRYRYKNCDLTDLETQLKAATEKNARFKLIVTDGVFSMDGLIAPLKEICDLADKYQALIMVDDSHAVGFLGAHGKGTHELTGCLGRIDILTGTLGKALGGASGGYLTARKEIVDLLRQRSRPYLFSNTLAPSIAAASLKALDLVEQSPDLLQNLARNTKYFRQKMTDAGFTIPGGTANQHPICPVMMGGGGGDAVLAQKIAARMLDLGVYVIGFFYPVVPQGKARIRTQMSAAHTIQDLDTAINAFIQARKEIAPS
jgi:glycine C-acetyltransferase